MADHENLDLKLPKPVLKYFNGILKKIPPQTKPPLQASSYHIPSATERSASKALLSSSAASIINLEAEIAKLHLITKAFELRLENIRAFNKYHQSLVSPVRQLPDELLSEIFNYACDDRIYVCNNGAVVWRLQCVCVRWRRLIQGSPFLWSGFVLNTIKGGDPAIIARRIQWCLRFSGTVPLEVVLASESGYPILPAIVYDEMASHAYRWKELALDRDCFYDGLGKTNAMMLIQHSGLAQLRKLEVTGFGGCFPSYMFCTAMALEDVCIRSSVLPEGPAFPWGNVKKLIVYSSMDEHRDIGSVFSALTSLKELRWGYGLSPVLGKVVTLPNLQTLNLESAERFLPLLPMLRTPCLTCIRLIYDISPDLNPLILMVKASDCLIKQITISYPFALSNNTVLQLLQGFPTLEELSLHHWHVYKDAVLRLAWGQDKLLPSLRKLELLTDITLDKDMIDYITAIVSSRSFPPTESGPRPISSSVPLSFLRCTSEVYEPDYKAYNEELDELRRLGKERNVQMEIEIEIYWPLATETDSSCSEDEKS